jgi:predicted acetyltransferase
MGFDIRTVAEDEFEAWQTTNSVAFFSHIPPDTGSRWKRPFVDLDRCWAAFDNGRPVATLRSFGNEITVPGGAQVAADAVTNVAVLPTHRRRGSLNGMMSASLAQAAERGDPVSILIAARWLIYGRYGYGPATEGASYTVSTEGFALRPEVARLAGTGSIEIVKPAELRAQVDAIFDRFRAGQVGAIKRQPELVDRTLGLNVGPPGFEPPKGYCALRRDTEGRPDGYLHYDVDDAWQGMQPDCTLTVHDLVAATPAAYAALWAFCAEMDNVVRVKAADRSVDEPLRWLLQDGRAMTRDHQDDMVWLRILDVAKALSARSYRVAGALVVQVTDPHGHAEGRYLLDGGPDGASCSRTDAPADLTLPAYALGAAYLGGTRLRNLVSGGGATEHTPGALSRADLMFLSEVTPWCNTWF